MKSNLRRTKIVGTIGPASENILPELFEAGLNVCRINYSHGSYDEQEENQKGGIDLFVGGVGADGHIAFNEPFSSLTSQTRVKTLTTETMRDKAKLFDNDINKVPHTILTVGIGTIMSADEVLLLATGKEKAKATKAAIEGGVNHRWAVSALQMHKHGIYLCDEDATSTLEKDTVSYLKDIERNAY